MVVHHPEDGVVHGCGGNRLDFFSIFRPYGHEAFAAQVEGMEVAPAFKSQEAVRYFLQVGKVGTGVVEEEDFHLLAVVAVQGIACAEPDEPVAIFADGLDGVVRQAVFHGQQVEVLFKESVAGQLHAEAQAGGQ